ncbi:MAG TPA: hypothetical protein VH878_03745 [Thermodesulfobacteriota bacterium]|jgi:hypothetical protein
MIRVIVTLMFVLVLISGMYSCAVMTGNYQSAAEEEEEPPGAEYDPLLRRAEPYGPHGPLYDPYEEEEVESWEYPLRTEEIESEPLFK